MSTTAAHLGTVTGVPEGAAGRSLRRNREELEQLAAEFVQPQAGIAEPPAPAVLPGKAFAAVGGVFALAVLAWLLAPTGQSSRVREIAPAVDESELWAKRLEAGRERQRLELQQSREYLQKMAEADRTLVGEMTARAQGLARRDEQPLAPVARSRPPVDEPTPKVEPRAAAAPAPVSASPATPGPAAPVSPVAHAPAAAPATQAPAPVAASDCAIHVSELSSSGKLTYADVARMKGARVDAKSGKVSTPPVRTDDGRTVVFEVMPSGCVRLARQMMAR